MTILAGFQQTKLIGEARFRFKENRLLSGPPISLIQEYQEMLSFWFLLFFLLVFLLLNKAIDKIIFPGLKKVLGKIIHPPPFREVYMVICRA